MQTTNMKSRFGPREVRQLQGFDDAAAYRGLEDIGIVFRDSALKCAMDSLTGPLTTPSIGTPVEFLRHMLPGQVSTVTGVRKADTLTGLDTGGRWEDEEVVQRVVEALGDAQEYGDQNDVPYASYNTNFERRTIVRFELGMELRQLEEARASAMAVNAAAEKRQAATNGLEIMRNRVAFYGFNGGANRTYGFLNDPALPVYQTVPNGASGNSLWSSQTFAELQRQIQIILGALEVNSKGLIDSRSVQITLAIPTGHYQYLTTSAGNGSKTVLEWISENYPNVRIEQAPELIGANSSANVLYAYAERIEDGSTDGGGVFSQVVPARFLMLGAARNEKGYSEDYSMATAGVMCKRPFAVYRVTGI